LFGSFVLKKDEEKEKLSIFLRRANTFNLNSNSRIQIQTEPQQKEQCSAA